MNTQMDRPRGQSAYGDHDIGPQVCQGHEEGEHHGEKKSVLGKVKAKAKKIKNTITGHHGHGQEAHHDHDDDDDDDEMDIDPAVHDSHSSQDFTPRQGVHIITHEVVTVRKNPDGHQTFIPTTDYVPGQEETLEWSRTDTGRPMMSEEPPLAPKNTPALSHLTGNRSTGDLGIGHKPKLGGILEKESHPLRGAGEDIHSENRQAGVTDPTARAAQGLGLLPGQAERSRQHGNSLADHTAMDGATHVPVSEPQGYQIFDTSTKYIPGQEQTLGWSRTDTGRPIDMGEQHHIVGGMSMASHPAHTPANKPQGNQNFEISSSKHIPGQEETLGWSRTDIGRPAETEGRHPIIGSMPMTSHQGADLSTGDLGRGHKEKPAGVLERDPHAPTRAGEGLHPANYQAKVTDPTARGGYGSKAVQGLLQRQGGTTRQHVDTMAGKAGSTAMEGATHVPVSKPVENQTFDTSSDKYIPGQEKTSGWSRTDTGRPRGLEERHHTTGDIPVTAQLGGHLDRGVHQIGHETGNLRDILQKPSSLEKDPQGPREVGERGQAENYESKVTDPTGRGSEEMGVPPIVHQLGKMDIHDDRNRNQPTGSYTEPQESFIKPNTGREEKSFTGSQDQFFSEPNCSETHSYLPAPNSNPQPEEKQGSYTEKIAAAASMVADKAKQATNTVTSKLGYGSSGEQLYTPSAGPIDELAVPESLDKQPLKGPLDKERVPGGYGDTLSSVGNAISGTATSAKGAVASKLGYGGTHEEQVHHTDGASKSGSIADYGKKVATTVQEKLTPVYEKVAEMGSTVASKVPGSGTASVVQTSNFPTLVPDSETTHEVPSTVTSDKGVSVKDYLVEKLKPGEEDKALSEVITEALPLHKRKENLINAGQGPEGKTIEIKEHVSESEGTRKVEIKGRVTESEEVAQRLGRCEETDYDGVGPGLASPGKGVMDRIKDAASTWFTRSGESTEFQTAAGNYSSEEVMGGFNQNQGVGEPRVK